MSRKSSFDLTAVTAVAMVVLFAIPTTIIIIHFLQLEEPGNGIRPSIQRKSRHGLRSLRIVRSGIRIRHPTRKGKRNGSLVWLSTNQRQSNIPFLVSNSSRPSYPASWWIIITNLFVFDKAGDFVYGQSQAPSSLRISALYSGAKRARDPLYYIDI